MKYIKEATIYRYTHMPDYRQLIKITSTDDDKELATTTFDTRIAGSALIELEGLDIQRTEGGVLKARQALEFLSSQLFRTDPRTVSSVVFNEERKHPCPPEAVVKAFNSASEKHFNVHNPIRLSKANLIVIKR